MDQIRAFKWKRGACVVRGEIIRAQSYKINGRTRVCVDWTRAIHTQWPEANVGTRRKTIEPTGVRWFYPISRAKETRWVPYRSSTQPRLGRINRINIVEEKLRVKIGALSRYGLSCLLIRLCLSSSSSSSFSLPHSLHPLPRACLYHSSTERSIDEGACKIHAGGPGCILYKVSLGTVSSWSARFSHEALARKMIFVTP